MAVNTSVHELVRECLRGIHERVTYKFMEEAMSLSEKGLDVISFGIGQPDFGAPSFVIEEAKKALDEGLTRYTSPKGTVGFREAVAEYARREYGVEVKPSEVIAVPGGSTGIFMSLYLFAGPGDKVLVPDPGFPQYFDAIRALGSKPIPMRLREEPEGFRMDPRDVQEALETNTGVKAMIVNSPHNPTGMMISREDFMRILDEARDHGVVVISDEVYDHFTYDDEHTSCLQHPDWRSFCIHVNSLSKTYGMTGWRIGFIIAESKVIDRLSALANATYGCLQPFIMKAAEKALRSSLEWFEEINKEYKARRDLVHRELNSLPGFKCPRPRGAFYAYPNASEALKKLGLRSTEEFARKLLESKGVLMLPGTAFSLLQGHEYLRISYALPKDRILEGLSRVREFIEENDAR